MSMEHNKHPAENIEFLEQASSEFAKEEKEPEIQTEKIHKPNVEESEAIVTSGDESPFPVRMLSDDSSTDSSSDVSDSEAIAEEESKEPEIQTEEIPKPNVEESESPFPVRMVPYKRYFSDDSSTDSSYFSDSDSDSEAIAEEESKEPEIQTEETPNVEESEAIVTSDDESPFPVRMVPYNRHFSDDSSTDSSYFSDSDETIADEESKINKENSTKDRDDQTPTEPLKESKINKENSPKDRKKQLKFDYDPETQAIQLAKSSTTELNSGPTVLTSSILVKHGTKRPAEAEVGDEESKRAKKLALSNSTIENVKNWLAKYSGILEKNMREY